MKRGKKKKKERFIETPSIPGSQLQHGMRKAQPTGLLSPTTLSEIRNLESY